MTEKKLNYKFRYYNYLRPVHLKQRHTNVRLVKLIEEVIGFDTIGVISLNFFFLIRSANLGCLLSQPTIS